MLPRRLHLLLFTPLALILLPFLVTPAVLGFVSSFTDYAPLKPHVHFVGASNYVTVLGDDQLRHAFQNIALVVLAAVPAELVLGFAIAYALREPIRGRGVIRVLLLVPWSVSPIATGVMWHFLYNDTVGLPNFWLAWLRLPAQPSPLGLLGQALPALIAVEIWRKAPLVSFLLLPGLLALPADLWEHATLEGATFVQRLRHIIAPSVRPLLLVIALLLVADTLGTFETVLMMTGGGPGSGTLTPVLYSFQRAFQASNWPEGVVSSWLVVGAILLVGAAYVAVSWRGMGEGDPLPLEESPGGWPPRRGRAWGRLAVVGASGLAIALPLVWTLLASFGVTPDDVAHPPVWILEPSVEPYAALVAADPLFPQEFATSLALAVSATLLTITVAFLASYSVSRSRARNTPMVVQGFLLLATMPVIAYVIPLSDLTRYAHLNDTFLGVALASVAVYAPLAVFVLYGYISRVAPVQEEMARLDGASLPRVLWAIVAPAVLPGLGATSVLVFILNWNLFLVPLTLALPHIRTVPTVLSDFFLFERDLEWTTAAAALVVSLVPSVVLVALAHRALERFTLRATRPAP